MPSVKGFTPRPSAQSALVSVLVEGVALGAQACADGAVGLDRRREHVVFRGDPAQRHLSIDLLDVARAALRALAAGGAAPDVLPLDLGQAEGGLPDQLAHAELSTRFQGQTVSHFPHW